MLRARGFTQDDSHIFCRPDQVVDEVVACITFARDLYRAFGLGEPSRVAVSTTAREVDRDDRAVGAGGTALMDAARRIWLRVRGGRGGGGLLRPQDRHPCPRRDRSRVAADDDPGRLQPAGRFGLAYIGEDGQKHEPYMVHRALFGSIERFFAVLLESTNGAFPFWLAPEQVRVVPVAATSLITPTRSRWPAARPAARRGGRRRRHARCTHPDRADGEGAGHADRRRGGAGTGTRSRSVATAATQRKGVPLPSSSPSSSRSRSSVGAASSRPADGHPLALPAHGRDGSSAVRAAGSHGSGCVPTC
jgi:hypothetical protein